MFTRKQIGLIIVLISLYFIDQILRNIQMISEGLGGWIEEMGQIEYTIPGEYVAFVLIGGTIALLLWIIFSRERRPE